MCVDERVCRERVSGASQIDAPSSAVQCSAAEEKHNVSLALANKTGGWSLRNKDSGSPAGLGWISGAIGRTECLWLGALRSEDERIPNPR